MMYFLSFFSLSSMVLGIIFLFNSLLLSDRSILNDKFLEPFDLAVLGGGSAGFMTAITAAENWSKKNNNS